MELEDWQLSLKNGNKCFDKFEYSAAESYYFEAFDLLEQKLLVAPNCRETLFAWTATCHNLSTLFERSGELRLALHYLNTPHNYCHKMLVTDRSDSIALMQAMNVTWQAIQKFSKKNPAFIKANADQVPSRSALNLPNSQLH